MKKTFISSVALIAGLSSPLMVQTTFARTPDSAADGSPEQSASGDEEQNAIVVTARKRAESLQDVPMTISVVTGTKLAEQQLTDVQSLQSVTSGLVVRRTSNNVVNLTLRGLGTGSVVEAFEQSVATFVDGTYVGRPQEFNAALFDLDRVELIKGGQASLLSKNTSLGAISLNTRKPGTKFAFNASASYEFALGSRQGEVGVDIPLSDTLQVRLAGQYVGNRGFLKNDINGREYPKSDNYIGRVVAHWIPADGIEATFLYQHFDNKLIGLPIEYISDPTGQLASLAALSGQTVEFNFDRHTQMSSALGDAFDKTKGDRAIATVNFEIGDYTLTSVSSYSHFHDDLFRDTDFLPGDFVTNQKQQQNKQYSQELRLTSPTGGAIDYVAGLAFLSERWQLNQRVVAQCIGCTPTQLMQFNIRGAFDESDVQNTKNYAAFAQINGHLTDAFTVSAGGRVTHETRNALLQRTTLVPGLLTAVIYNPFPATLLRRKETNFDGSLVASYEVDPSVRVYASAARGSKSGGFINFATNPTTPAGRIAAEYGNEKATTYEVGAKISLAAGGFFNVALFNTDVKNFQQATFVSPNYITTQRNIRSRGVEVESAVALTQGVRLSAQVTYADTRRRDAGHYHPQGAPLWSGNANLAIRQPLTDSLSFTADAGVEFRSSSLTGDAESTIGFPGKPNNSLPKTPAYGLINARVGVKSESGWELALIGRNLGDRKFAEYATTAVLVSTRGASVVENQPRTVALQISYKY